MPHQDRTLPKPLRFSGQDIVFAESLPHGCPRQEKETSIGERCKSQSGKKQMLKPYENVVSELVTQKLSSPEPLLLDTSMPSRTPTMMDMTVDAPSSVRVLTSLPEVIN